MAQFFADRVAVGSHRAVTPEGYLLVKDVPIARTGTQTYRAEEVDRDGSLGLTGLVDVYRPKEEIFSPAALASFEGKSVTCPHPPAFLTPDNDGHYSRGHVQNVRAGREPLPSGEWPVMADLLIKDRTVIGQVDAGVFAELSAGYSYDLTPLASGGFAQTNIRGNHVALVSNGRAGSEVRVLDSCPEEVCMEKEVAAVGELSALGSFFRGLKEAGLRLVQATDAESDTVNRQEEIAKKSNSMKERTVDKKAKDADELEKEDEKADKPVEKKAKDADEKEEERKATDSALLRTIADGIGKLVKAADAKAKDDDEEEKEEKKAKAEDKDDDKEKEGEDADLIPVETLKGEEVPENPIPGADEAIASLRELRPLIAATVSKTGDRQIMDSFNNVMNTLKGRVKTEDNGYDRFSKTKKPDVVKNAEDRARLSVGDSKDKTEANDNAFFEGAAKFHRKNASEVIKPN